jgi:MoaA/NifB/PqqE/SkfB family radical SAM enzyme
MAAVAGSKGRIVVTQPRKPSFQATLAGRLLDGNIQIADVVNALTTAAQLREIGVDTNMICNLACKYCYLDDRPAAKGLISSTQWKTNLEPLIDAGCKLVAFIGKEPLADDIALDTVNLLKDLRCSGRNFRIGMVTNGTLMHRRIHQIRMAQLDYLDVSLDSFKNANDKLRGEGVFDRVTQNLKRYLETMPVHDFSVTSVLHALSAKTYPHFVDFLFSLGIKTAFGSPILRFTEHDTAADVALSIGDLTSLFEDLARYLDMLPPCAREDRQIIIDLPYKYSWLLLESGAVSWTHILQDAYEAHFLKPHSHLPLYIKFNFFPMSYWRAIRITHDGRILENMDLAAHRSYHQYVRDCADTQWRWYFGSKDDYHTAFLTDFVCQHANGTRIARDCYDRNVAKQYEHLAKSVAVQASCHFDEEDPFFPDNVGQLDVSPTYPQVG